MIDVWPWPVRVPMLESLEWQTDIIRTTGAEQRIALRTVPRRTLSIKSSVRSGTDVTAIRSAIRSGLEIGIPDWALFIKSSYDLSPGVGVELILDAATEGRLREGPVVVQQSDQQERANLYRDDFGAWRIDSISRSFKAPVVVNILPGTLPRGISITHVAGAGYEVEADVTVHDTIDMAAQDLYPQYRGHDLLTDCPITTASAEPIGWDLQTFDNLTGRPAHVARRDHPEAAFEMRWQAFGQSAALDLRRWLYSRRGRQRSFWMPSRSDDFALSHPVAASDRVLRCRNDRGLALLGSRPTLDIIIRTHDGREFLRQVTAISAAGDWLDLHLDASLGSSLSVSETKSISLLRHVRFNADRLEIEHGGLIEPMRVAVPLIEVPIP